MNNIPEYKTLVLSLELIKEVETKVVKVLSNYQLVVD